MKYIPPELIEIVISFCDYEKYHRKKFLPVLEDIKQMGTIFVSTIPPYLAYRCWGNGYEQYQYSL